MKYQANPVIVEAHRIVSVGEINPETKAIPLALDNGENVETFSLMTCRLPDEIVKPGDYWVIQEDGYVYLNPKAVFERKYSQLVTPENVPDEKAA